MITNLRCSVSLAALALASGLAVSSPVSAADLPVKAMRPMAPAVTSWHGFYLGSHLGAGDAKTGGFVNFDPTDSVDNIFPDVLNLGGVLGGIHGGYNWDFGTWVAGIEGDWSFMRWKGAAHPANSSESMLGEVNNLASIRARIGIPVDNDRRGLTYLTAGVGFADAKVTVFDAGRGAPGTNAEELKFNRVAPVIGGGFEWAATQQVRVRLEGLYYLFNQSRDLTLAEAAPGDHVKLENIWTVRAGATWYFNTPAVGKGPVVSRY